MSDRRCRTIVVGVRVSPEEYRELKTIADDCSLTVPSLLRGTGLGHRPSSTIDQAAIHGLDKLAADFGRVGGLLKLWLTQRDIELEGRRLGAPDLITEMRAVKRRIERKIAQL